MEINRLSKMTSKKLIIVSYSVTATCNNKAFSVSCFTKHEITRPGLEKKKLSIQFNPEANSHKTRKAINTMLRQSDIS